MRAMLHDVIGSGEIFEAKARRAVLSPRPFDAVRPQRVAHPREIDHVPTRVAVFPLARVRIVEITIEEVTRELVVEAQRVVADGTGSRFRERLVHARGELGFDDAFELRALWRDTSDKARAGRGQHIEGRFAKE